MDRDPNPPQDLLEAALSENSSRSVSYFASHVAHRQKASLLSDVRLHASRNSAKVTAGPLGQIWAWCMAPRLSFALAGLAAVVLLAVVKLGGGGANAGSASSLALVSFGPQQAKVRGDASAGVSADIQSLKEMAVDLKLSEDETKGVIQFSDSQTRFELSGLVTRDPAVTTDAAGTHHRMMFTTVGRLPSKRPVTLHAYVDLNYPPGEMVVPGRIAKGATGSVRLTMNYQSTQTDMNSFSWELRLPAQGVTQ